MEPDSGVEYQLIKYKKDLERGDRETMKRKACWRYRKFVEEAMRPSGQRGVKALEDPCNDSRNPDKWARVQ